MTNTVLNKLFLLLFLLFLAGTFYLIYFSRKDKNILILSRASFVIFFFFPFFLYFLAGLVNIKFGWARNFFCLLPIYFLLIFYGLKVMISNKKYYYIVSTVILVFILQSGISDSVSWEKVNLEREMVRYAAKIDNISIVLFSRRIAKWPFRYYSQKNSVQDRAVFFIKDVDIERQTMVLEKIPDNKTFAIIETLSNGELIKEGKYSLGAKSFDIIKTEEHEALVGPFQSLRKVLGYTPSRIVVYFCKNSQKD